MAFGGILHPSIAGRDSAALGLAAVCWGLGTVISKAALGEIPPLSLLTIQLGSSVAILALIMRRQGIPMRDDRQKVLGRLGLLNPGVAYALSLLGLLTITASLSVVLWALEPLVILVLAGVFLGERITPGLVALSLAAVAGMVFAIYEPSNGGDGLVGVALTLAGVGCCAVYTVVTRRFIPNAAETGQVVLSQQAHALLLAFALSTLVALLGGQVIPSGLTTLGLASAVGSGVLYYAGAYWFYLGALRRVPASIAASSFYLIPIVGLAGGAVLLGERLAPSQWLGAAIVLGSVLAIAARYNDRGATRVSAPA